MRSYVGQKLRRTAGLVLVLAVGGCTLFKPSLRVELSGQRDINHGIPFHMLLRAVTTDQFRSETYTQVARLAAQADKSVLRAEVIYTPSSRPYQMNLSLPPPKGSSIGLYFLFTAPTGNWRMLIEPPLPKVVRVALGEGSIVSSKNE